jgi:hypothetical protein
MKKKRNYISSRLSSGQAGQALIIVLIFLLLGSLTLVPTLTHISTALKTGEIYENNTNEIYAADSGVEDAIWRIKYDSIDPDYNAYDFSTIWQYNLDDHINNMTTNVSIQNVWIPSNVDPPTDPVAAKEIIKKNKLVVAGTSSTSNTTCKIVISFYPEAGENLTVNSIGIWLPQGFTYAGSCNLEDDIWPRPPYYSIADVADHDGGQAIVWDFSTVPFTSFPGVDADVTPQVTEITFQITKDVAGTRPTTISWLETEATISDILPVTWDIDTRIFKIISQSGDTVVEAYSSRCELRKMLDAIAGDYVATGNTVLYASGGGARSTWTNPQHSSAQTVSTIPHSVNDGYADVIAAYLYWSGWYNEGTKTTTFTDTCSTTNFANFWTNGGDWVYYSSGANYRAKHSGDDSRRTLTLKTSLNIAFPSPARVMVSWYQKEDGNLEADDGLDFSFSTDGGSNWSENFEAFRDDLTNDKQRYFKYVIPTDYQSSTFKIRFKLVGFNESDDNYCYLDNIKIEKITPDGDVTFKIADLNPPAPDAPDYEGVITASKIQVLPNSDDDGTSHGYSYSSYADVTNLVQTYSTVYEDEYENEHQTGNGQYTVGGIWASTGDSWSYAGWSIIIIYSSPKTAGHQLYLYDKFSYADMYGDVDFDGDGEPGGTISGFIVPQQIPGEVNAAKLTCFVGEGDVGDSSWGKDFLAFNAPESYRTNPLTIPNTYKLYDGKSCWNNSSAVPNNVWNNKSIDLTVDGIDIDTFYIPWLIDGQPGLLQSGDTSARIDLPTEMDSWNLIYIILSFRSKTVIGGTTHYVIHGG